MSTPAGLAPVWSISGREALERFAADERGLLEADAAERLVRFGRNELEEVKPPSPWTVLVRQFRSPLIFILALAAAVTVALGKHVDAAVISAVLVINGAIGFTQELRAQRSMEALRRLARAVARVLRGGRELEVDAATLVPGDVVFVEAGDKVPADCRLLRAVALEVDESLLTGESTTVAKTATTVEREAPLAERASMLFTGTVVTRGRGQAVVVATGAATELGRIAGSVRRIEETESPLQRRIGRFARVVGVAILATSALGLAVGAARGEEIGGLFLAVVALAVAAIPEGLPIVLTVVLAIGLRRMADRNAVIRKLPAVETLGSCTVIGSDKTGTLTENRMTVERIVAGGREFTVTGAGYAGDGEIRLDGRPAPVEEDSPLHLTLLAGALCNDASAVATDAGEFDVRGDPTEVALLVAAAKAGLAKDALDEEWVRMAEIPFEPERRYAATFNRRGDRTYAFVKGAPEAVLAFCAADSAEGQLGPPAVLEAAGAMAGSGLRVLATAYREVNPDAVVEEDPHRELGGLTFLGLQGMIDPPRAEARDAVAASQSAGIRVLMITGDHGVTAAAIADELGIADADRGAVSGRELEHLSEEELRRLVRERAVFARVAPEHKLRIVRALQANGETVAVTGDGVNDAPALRAADIGAAMGRSGTDVAREAADMIVTDDNFASIAAAVEEGRIAFDNVRKTTFFLISTGAAAIAIILTTIFAGLPLPLLPAQLLWLNLVTNGIQDVALAFEPGEKDVLRRPPRARREGVISALLWERTAVAGLVMAAGTLGLFLVDRAAHGDLDRARTVALTTMVLFQVFHVGNSRSEHLSAFRKSPFSNRFLFLGTAAAIAVHVGALHLPFTQYVLRVEPLDATTWLTMVAVASSVIAAVELHKLIRKRFPVA